MKVSIITLFPEMFANVLDVSILGRAKKKGLLETALINLRDFGIGSHQQVDDRPYGGGVGMILRPDVLAEAVKYAKKGSKSKKTLTILMSASGQTFNQKQAGVMSRIDHLILVCGHYEGVDDRFIKTYIDLEISIGDYILTGGEIPAMVVVDSVVRLIPGVLEKVEATQNESFSNDLLEHPQYTRPTDFEGEPVPEVLVSGDHAKIQEWRDSQSFKRTKKVRPDLLDH